LPGGNIAVTERRSIDIGGQRSGRSLGQQVDGRVTRPRPRRLPRPEDTPMPASTKPLTIVCLHCSASSSAQWAALAESLAAGVSASAPDGSTDPHRSGARQAYRVIAPDLYGSGRAPDWPGGSALTLDAEAARVEAQIPGDVGVVLVGHSYGAAVALRLALRRRISVEALVVHEPVLFNLLCAAEPDADEARDVAGAGAAIARAFEEGRPELAAQRFVDYWSGAGTWERMDRRVADRIAARIGSVVWQFEALFADAVPLSHYAQIAVPVLMVSGGRTRAITRRVGELLHQAMPHAASEVIAEAGHMGPVTHAGMFNALLQRFLGMDLAVTLRRAA
jgi:pimeloyl-ACP methyl ester carboxylesterase